MSLVLTTPQFPPAVAPVSLDLVPVYHGLMNEFQGRRPVHDATSLENARDLLRKLSHCRTAVDQSRTAAKDPFYRHSQEIDKLAKPFLDKLAEMIALMKKEMADYSMAVEAARMKQEAERAKLEEDAAFAANDGRTAPIITTMGLPIERAAVPTRDDIEFDGFDVAKIPVQYLVPNEALIKQELLKGTVIPGVTYRKVKKVIAR